MSVFVCYLEMQGPYEESAEPVAVFAKEGDDKKFCWMNPAYNYVELFLSLSD
jgi:hypothetical protein